MNEKPIKQNPMIPVATWIVDKRNLIFLVVIISLIFSFFSRNWVTVENQLSAYLPADSDTKTGLDLMDQEFTTFGTARVMVASVTYAQAEEIESRLEALEGVQSVSFDDTQEHYNNASALYTITFDYDEDEDECLEALERVEDSLSEEDYYVSTDLGNALAEAIDEEVSKIMVYVAIIVVAILILTSQTYAEVIVLLLTFVIAMLLNQGSSFLLGTISFVSNSVTSILQLALSLDYAVIFCNHFREQHESLPVREAVIVALSKAIPEISASCLTTVGGLCAMLFMQFQIGPDMAISLIKSIAYALLSVFLVMPGLLVLFGPLMDKTAHRSFIPKISFVGKWDYATRFVVPIIFVVVFVGAGIVSQKTPYVYGEDSLSIPVQNETQLAEELIEENFSNDNFAALVFPAGDFSKEAALIAELEEMEEVKSVVGLANTEAMDGYTLTDRLTPRQFSELTDIDYELAEVLYGAYAVNDEDYGKVVGGLSTYSVCLMDMLSFAYDEVEAGYVTLDDDVWADLQDAHTQLENGKKQLMGEEYDRILVYLDLPVGGDETYAFLDTMEETAQSYYPDGKCYVVGDSSNEYDFKKTFQTDNVVVSAVSILIVLAVLLFTFKSVGMPLLLIMVIQGSIWINYACTVFTQNNVFFMSYLVVSSIQMGANIDYAIVISSRFMEIKDTMPKRQAIIETMNFAFPTIVTSGPILCIAGTLIGRMTSEGAICGIGDGLGRGTLISIFLVLFVLPQILLVGEKLIDKSSFSMPTRTPSVSTGQRVRLDGMVRGTINGTVLGTFHGVVDGDVNVHLISGSMQPEDGDTPEDTEQEAGQPESNDTAEEVETTETAQQQEEDAK